MGAGHSDADFDAELGTQETGGTLVGHEAGNRGREPSPMNGMIHEVAVWCSNQCHHGDGLSPHNPAKGELHARETQWTKTSERSNRDRHWEGNETRQEQTVDGRDEGWSCSCERRHRGRNKKTFPDNDNWILSQEHDSTFKLLWRCSQLDFSPTRTRLNLKLAAVLVSTRCSHLFTKKFDC